MIRSALDVAVREILGASPIRELPGQKNRSPKIDAMNREVGLELGSPYCASGVSHCFRSFHREFPQEPGMPFPYSGGSQAILASFRAKGLSFTDPQRLLDCRGALGGWTNKDGAHGHIFIIKNRLTRNGLVTGIGTLEFNTSPDTKDRDGEGAYELRRMISELRASHPNFWFLDVSHVAGGVWWKK